MKTPLKYEKNGNVWFEMRYSERPVLILKVEKSVKFPGKYCFRYMSSSPLHVNNIKEVNDVLEGIGFKPLQEVDFDRQQEINYV